MVVRQMLQGLDDDDDDGTRNDQPAIQQALGPWTSDSSCNPQSSQPASSHEIF